MSASASGFHPSLSKSSTGRTSASESRSERAPSPVAEDRDPDIVNRFKERMQLRPRSRSDSWSSTATTLNHFDAVCAEAATRQPQRTSADAATEERKKARRRSSEIKPVKRASRRSTFSDVGRHSNQWIFGGFSVTDTARGLLKRRES